MKTARNTVLPALVFLSTLSAAWGLRWLASPKTEESRRNVIPAGIRTSSESTGTQAPGVSDVRLRELRSVSSGLVVIPPNASPEEVAAAFARAWEKLESGHGAEMKLQARQLFSDWLKLDPDAAIRYVSDPPGLLKRRGGEFLLTALAETDPERACQIALKGGIDGPEVAGSIMQVWGSRDAAAALAHAATLPAHLRLGAE